MVDTSKTLIAALLDRSGSMASAVEATQDGFNELINGQKGKPGTARVTLAQFDNVYELVYQDKPIDEVPPLVLIPRSMTALLDGVGKLITDTGEALAKLPEDERPGTVICLIMTDGGENASQEWTWESVGKLIKTQERDYNWQFLFVGANIDAQAVAGRIGIRKDRAMRFNSHDYGATRSVYAASNAVMDGMRSGDVAVAAAAGYSEAHRAEAMGDDLPPGPDKRPFGRLPGEDQKDWKDRLKTRGVVGSSK